MSTREINETVKTLIGGSIVTGGVVNVVAVNVTSGSNVGTGEDDLQTATVPASTLSVNLRTLRVTAWGIKANNANAKQVKLYFGATAILTTALAISAAGTWKIVAEIVRTGSSTQRCIAVMSGSDADIESNTALAITDTAAITVKTTGEAVSNTDITSQGLLIECIG